MRRPRSISAAALWVSSCLPLLAGAQQILEEVTSLLQIKSDHDARQEERAMTGLDRALARATTVVGTNLSSLQEYDQHIVVRGPIKVPTNLAEFRNTISAMKSKILPSSKTVDLPDPPVADPFVEVSPKIGVKPPIGKSGPYFELWVPKLSCPFRDRSTNEKEAYLWESKWWLEHFIPQCLMKNNKVRFYIGWQFSKGEQIYFPFDTRLFDKDYGRYDSGVGMYIPFNQTSHNSDRPLNFFWGWMHQWVMDMTWKWCTRHPDAYSQKVGMTGAVRNFYDYYPNKDGFGKDVNDDGLYYSGAIDWDSKGTGPTQKSIWIYGNEKGMGVNWGNKNWWGKDLAKCPGRWDMEAGASPTIPQGEFAGDPPAGFGAPGHLPRGREGQEEKKPSFDPCKVLGIQEETPPQEVKERFMKLAEMFHPDRPGGKPYVYKIINAAYKLYNRARANAEKICGGKAGTPLIADMEEVADAVVEAEKDTDGDGIPNGISTDDDGDGVPDDLDPDDNNNGVSDKEENSDDLDGDGISDTKEMADALEAAGISNEDPVPDESATAEQDVVDDGVEVQDDAPPVAPPVEDVVPEPGDSDGDGILDDQEKDLNGNQVPDDAEDSLSFDDEDPLADKATAPPDPDGEQDEVAPPPPPQPQVEDAVPAPAPPQDEDEAPPPSPPQDEDKAKMQEMDRQLDDLDDISVGLE